MYSLYSKYTPRNKNTQKRNKKEGKQKNDIGRSMKEERNRK